MQTHKKNKQSVSAQLNTVGQANGSKMGNTKKNEKVLEEKKQLKEEKKAAKREEQKKFIDETVNSRVREGLHMILSKIQVFIEDQIKSKVSEEVAVAMKTVKSELQQKK